MFSCVFWEIFKNTFFIEHVFMNWIQWNLLRSKKSSLVSGTYEMTVISIGLFRWSFFYLRFFTFLASLMAFLVPWKCRNCKFLGISSPYSSLWLTCFPFAKMPKAQWDRNKNMDTIIEVSVAHVQPLLLFSEN